MLPHQWETFKRAARLEKLDKIPMALIIDSPWMPGYLGIKHLDYFLDPELWFQSNLKIMQEFPDIIFVPSWWMEYGMAAEPSVLGAKIKFWQDNTPSEYHTLYRLEDIDNFPEYEVEADAFAGLTLHRIGMHRQRILDAGYILFRLAFRALVGFVVDSGNFAAYHGWVLRNVLTHPNFDLCYSSSLLSLGLPIVRVPCARGARYRRTMPGMIQTFVAGRHN